jgi:hypothetical protein
MEQPPCRRLEKCGFQFRRRTDGLACAARAFRLDRTHEYKNHSERRIERSEQTLWHVFVLRFQTVVSSSDSKNIRPNE